MNTRTIIKTAYTAQTKRPLDQRSRMTPKQFDQMCRQRDVEVLAKTAATAQTRQNGLTSKWSLLNDVCLLVSTH